ncbi:MAG: hypothetical protein JXQ97_15665 [Natronospirillum sp.]
MKKSALLFIGLLPLLPLSVSAQQRAQVDVDLLNQLDFRDVSFRTCFDQTSCTVGDVTIEGFRQDAITQEWLPTEIYWDPIDGLGILGGAQNDEIDVDERLVVNFAEPVEVNRLWLSDLFISEHGRYGGFNSFTENIEFANVEFYDEGAQSMMQMQISGVVNLPRDPFNETVRAANPNQPGSADVYPWRELGDMRRRVSLTNEEIILYYPDESTRRGQFLRVPIGDIDPEKKVIFAGLETVEIDILPLLLALDGAALFENGTRNADRIRSIIEEPALLSSLQNNAQIRRVVGTRDNGEVAGILNQPIRASMITIEAPLSTSNDFSVAGLVVN